MSIAKSSFLFSAGTLLSRVSGVMRESVIGAVFGASVFMDAFQVAFRIPNLLRELLAEGALGSSFTKVYGTLCVDNKEAAEKLLIQTLQFVVMVSIAVSAIGILFSEQLVSLMTMMGSSTGNQQFHNVTVSLTKVLFPFIGFASLGAIFQGVLYQRGGFFLAGVAPILFNVFSIIGALWLAPIASSNFSESVTLSFGDAGILGLAIGTLIGGAAQSGIQAYGVWKPVLSGKKLWPTKLPWSDDLRKVLWLMGPMVIAASSGQINVIINTNFATSLETGAVSWLYYAFRLIQLPIGMFGVAIGAAVLPALSKSITEAKGHVDAKASSEIFNALDLVAWLMVPCTLVLFLSAFDITRLLYEAGRFTTSDTLATAIAIQGYSYGLLSYGILKVMNSYYYATGRTKYPMYVSLLSIAGNYIANSILVQKYGHQGLAITASITLTMNALLLIAGMSKDNVMVPWKQVIQSTLLLMTGTFIVILSHRVVSNFLNGWSVAAIVNMNTNTWISKIDSTIKLAIDCLLIIGIFGTVGLKRINKTPKEAFRMLKRKR